MLLTHTGTAAPARPPVTAIPQERAPTPQHEGPHRHLGSGRRAGSDAMLGVGVGLNGACAEGGHVGRARGAAVGNAALTEPAASRSDLLHLYFNTEEGAAILCAEQMHGTSCAVEAGASGQPRIAGAGKELSFEHQEIRGPSGEQQGSHQHRVAEQHKRQQLPQHLEEVDGKGVRHRSPQHRGAGT
ncbi:uncharacterized protein LOC107321203 isoform X2 [Coturnix japonica]|uniref:uncharacterized protein LOC107321203 isoform X2 n=1 Tax=Coturnix japonica TaxID=93934 RepID=UPI0013A5D250|nr:uncharacterized protein LOC107321203 isoform X2 [Coturnix japonica]